MLALIMETRSFHSEKRDEQLYMVELSNNDTVFVDEEKYKTYQGMIGKPVMIQTKKYKNKAGSWVTSKSIFDPSVLYK